MKTATQRQAEFEGASPSSLYGQSGTFVAMTACNLILLLMLAACSQPVQAQVLSLRASGDDRAFTVAVPMERLTVAPSTEDRTPPVKSRWQRFDAVLNANRSRGYRVVESATNDGVRTSCYEPCVLNCCVSSGGFSLAGHGFGR